MNNSIIPYLTTTVSFNEEGFLNATSIAKYFGKLVGNYLRNERTKEYIEALAENLSVMRNSITDKNQLVVKKQGGTEQGTWLHPKLAVDFARWLDPKFAVWCDSQIETLLTRRNEAGQAQADKLLQKAQVELLTMVVREFGDKISQPAREALLVAGSEKFLGIDTGYRPSVPKTYTATEIGNRLGLSANKVGRLARQHNLKTSEHGIWVLDKAKHSTKNVETFRYFESAIPVIAELSRRKH